MADASVVLSSIGLVVASLGGAVALYNARKGALWKRAELANSQARELYLNEELLFACRCLDWNAGRLVVPKSLKPLLVDGAETIEHEQTAFNTAMSVNLMRHEAEADPRLQIYRTALDTLLTWLATTNSAIQRKLYKVEDIEDAGYYLRKVFKNKEVVRFIEAYGYQQSLEALATRFGIANRER